MNKERMDKGYYSWCLSMCVIVVAVDESHPPSCSQSLTAWLTKPCDAVTLRSHTKTQATLTDTQETDVKHVHAFMNMTYWTGVSAIYMLIFP